MIIIINHSNSTRGLSEWLPSLTIVDKVIIINEGIIINQRVTIQKKPLSLHPPLCHQTWQAGTSTTL
jgi:hypothetical protein